MSEQLDKLLDYKTCLLTEIKENNIMVRTIREMNYRRNQKLIAKVRKLDDEIEKF